MNLLLFAGFFSVYHGPPGKSILYLAILLIFRCVEETAGQAPAKAEARKGLG